MALKNRTAAQPALVFVLRGEYIELHQLLKATGLAASGGEGKMMVAQGLVEVDGAAESRKTAKIRAGQRVSARGETIRVSAALPG